MGLFDFLKKRKTNDQVKSNNRNTSKNKGFDVSSMISVKTEILNTSLEPEVVPVEKIIKGMKSNDVGLYPHEILLLSYAPKYYVEGNSYPGFWWYKYGREKDLKCSAQYIWEEELNESVKKVFIELKENMNSIASYLDGKQIHPSFTKKENELLEDLIKKLKSVDTRLKEIADLTILGKDIAYEESLEKLTAKREQMNNEYERLTLKKYEAKLSEMQLDILLEALEQFDPEKSDIEEIFSKTVQNGTLFNNHRLEILFKCGIVREFSAEKSR